MIFSEKSLSLHMSYMISKPHFRVSSPQNSWSQAVMCIATPKSTSKLYALTCLSMNMVTSFLWEPFKGLMIIHAGKYINELFGNTVVSNLKEALNSTQFSYLNSRFWNKFQVSNPNNVRKGICQSHFNGMEIPTCQ